MIITSEIAKGDYTNYSNLENMLFNDLRIDIDEFNKLDVSKVERLSTLYHSTNVYLLSKYMRRMS